MGHITFALTSTKYHLHKVIVNYITFSSHRFLADSGQGKIILRLSQFFPEFSFSCSVSPLCFILLQVSYKEITKPRLIMERVALHWQQSVGLAPRYPVTESGSSSFQGIRSHALFNLLLNFWVLGSIISFSQFPFHITLFRSSKYIFSSKACSEAL